MMGGVTDISPFLSLLRRLSVLWASSTIWVNPRKPAAPLIVWAPPEDRVEKVGVFRAFFQLDEFLVQAVQDLLGFHQEVLDDLLHLVAFRLAHARPRFFNRLREAPLSIPLLCNEGSGEVEHSTALPHPASPYKGEGSSPTHRFTYSPIHRFTYSSSSTARFPRSSECRRPGPA